MPANIILRVVAQYSGPAIQAGVFSDSDGLTLWHSEWDPTITTDMTITDSYEAGAFNICAMVGLVDE